MKAEAVTGDLLRGARPKRLVRQKGRWYLDVVRFSSKGDGVFQPKTHRIEGHAAILDAVRRSEEGQRFADVTARMLADGASDGAFELGPAGWVPARTGSSSSGEIEIGSRRSPTEAALAAEVVVLRATVEALMARVARLERKIVYDMQLAQIATTRSGAHAIDAFARSPLLEDAAVPSRDGAHLSRHEEAPAMPSAPAVAASSPAVQAPTPAVAKAAPPLRLPSVVVLVNLLKDLAGQDVPLKEMKGARPEWTATPERYFVSWLVDDANNEVGGLLCDAEAVARLGGALLMLPHSEIDAQVTAGTPSEDAKMAASEICNNLTGPINDVPTNPHVRARAIAPLKGRVPDWLESARARLVCAHPGGGKLAVVAR